MEGYLQINTRGKFIVLKWIVVGVLVIVLLLVGVFGGLLISGRLFGGEGTIKVTQIRVDLEKAQMTHRVSYGRQDFSLHITAREQKIPIPITIPGLDPDLLVVVAARCEGGIDYEKNPAAVEYDDARKRVKVVVSDVEILECHTLENGVSFFQIGGLFAASPQLTTQLYSQAMKELQTKANTSDLLDTARDSANIKIREHLLSLGFDRVEIIFVAPRNPSKEAPMIEQQVPSIPRR